MKLRFFEEAKKESYLSDYDGAHLGAVATFRDKYVIARAHNTYKTNPTQFHYNHFRMSNKGDILTKPARAHCEIQLYRQLRFLNVDPKDIIVYIYRELKDGTMALAKPCVGCKKCLVTDFGIRTICWTDADGYVEKRYKVKD